MSDIDQYLDSLSDKTRERLTPIISEESPVLYYHVSENGTIKHFTPRVPDFRLYDEDQQTPRVCVANSALGCLIGYQRIISDFINGDPDRYKGGWYIYGIESSFALKPNKALVKDSLRSGEHWLVPYTKDRWEYPAKLLGKVFFGSVTHYNDYQYKTRLGKVTCYVEVFEGHTLNWSKAVDLKPGYHYLELNLPNETAQWNRHRHDVIVEITEEEYLEKKKLVADQLSHKEDHTPKVGDYLNVENDLLIDPGPCTYEVVKRDGDKYWTSHNPPGEDPYEIPAKCFVDSTVDSKSGDRICTAEPVKGAQASSESFICKAPSIHW